MHVIYILHSPIRILFFRRFYGIYKYLYTFFIDSTGLTGYSFVVVLCGLLSGATKVVRCMVATTPAHAFVAVLVWNIFFLKIAGSRYFSATIPLCRLSGWYAIAVGSTRIDLRTLSEPTPHIVLVCTPNRWVFRVLYTNFVWMLSIRCTPVYTYRTWATHTQTPTPIPRYPTSHIPVRLVLHICLYDVRCIHWELIKIRIYMFLRMGNVVKCSAWMRWQAWEKKGVSCFFHENK